MGFWPRLPRSQIHLDARITPIYEGTNGIQAMDLVGRKLTGDGGAAMSAMIADVRDTARDARATNQPKFVAISDRLDTATAALESATAWMLNAMKANRETGLSGATAYLRLAGDVVGAHFLTQAALGEPAGREADRATAAAHFFADDTLPHAPGLAAAVSAGAESLRGADVLWAAD